jgi:hypothetical protein
VWQFVSFVCAHMRSLVHTHKKDTKRDTVVNTGFKHVQFYHIVLQIEKSVAIYIDTKGSVLFKDVKHGLLQVKFDVKYKLLLIDV